MKRIIAFVAALALFLGPQLAAADDQVRETLLSSEQDVSEAAL